MRHVSSTWSASSLILVLMLVFTGRSNVAVAEEITSKYIRQSAGADTVIVFVHGMMGDGVSTWTNKNTQAYWPILLTKDTAFDGADVYAYSYSTGFWTTLTIDELAENMRADLKASGVSAYKNIIFISHSMGGLVTRAYLLKNTDVAARTSFAYFFSTPTTGVQIASLLQYISSSQQIVKIKTMNAEDYLADLYRQWLAAKFQFPSYCAYEKRPTSGILIVTMASAAALGTRALDPIDTDHIDIVKPDNQNSMSYVVFKAAYADAKIPELSKQLDQIQSLRIQSEIAELARFPDGQDTSTPRTIIERLSVYKLPLRIYGVLEHHTKPEIIGVPRIGETLYQYKQEYYDFQASAVKWEDNVTTKIGSKVSVRFRQAWQIYLQYAILRFTGNTKDTIIAGGDFLNYGITWDDAERVFTELASDQAAAQGTATLLASWKRVADEATKISSTIQN